MDWAITASGIRKRYGTLQALDGVSLEVAPGECFALLGPNGAGKTTLTEILEGYRHRDSGDATVLGVDPQRGDLAWRARIGIVLQSNRDLGDLTVAEAVRHFAGYYPDPRDPDAVIGAVGLDGKRRSPIGKLSGGQRRRLDVALGIIGRPRLLFLDEPTTGFDPEARRDFWSLVEGLSAEGTTILLTTHYLEEAEHLADRVAVICDGAVLACGPPRELGGPERRAARVSWDEHGTRMLAETGDPTRFVLDLAARFDGEIPGLEVRRASLEDVYLSLIAGTRASTGSDGDESPLVDAELP